MKGKRPQPWLIYALTTMMFWGFWGAFTNVPAQNGFPDTLIYCVWALTMLVPTVFILKRSKARIQLDKKSLLYGFIVGFLGAGGQMVLFYSLTIGPAYLIFPIISLSPVVTIVLSFFLLRERTGWMGAIGILLAMIALPLFEYSENNPDNDNGTLWFILSIIILIAWGVQAFFLKLANRTMQVSSIFFYMAIAGIDLIPVAIYMTDFSQEINWGINGPFLAAGIQILNSVGVLCLVYAFRTGKAIVVSPLTNAGAPLITTVISMLFLGLVPGWAKITGILFAVTATFLLALDSEKVDGGNNDFNQPLK
ncbi:EamA family transporter [Flagellimonas algicola]|uniref:DMT family transporter n=1 Tax=Flagellimonas algicola TaxID=2583815 RepID=A0ABY2WGM9_9FLAO|nr:EamA family transporter [Allomuricauda algicola]TMU50719.1 DMT family transporter [Allomuricauda algicola]